MSLKTLEARPAPGTALAQVDEMDPDLGCLRLVWQEWDEPFRVFLVRRGERVFAYRNQCPHALVHLDHPPGDFFSLDRQHLQCAFHGALFRVEDGFCVAGPCRDRSLRPFPIRVEDGVVFAAEPPKPNELTATRKRQPVHLRLARGQRG
jgi:nitrite reductase/ring-hydroxylating ferredoxin subunit